MKKVFFLLGHLSDVDIEWLIDNGQASDLEVGDQLITRNKKVENLYIILSGSLSIIGNNQTSMATIGQGEIVGEMSFLESHPPSVSVIAIEETTVFSISRDKVMKRLDENIEFRANFYYSISLFLSSRLRHTTQNLGFGNAQEEEDAIDAINENVLDEVSQAGSRFNQILQKFHEV
ncbi:MAG: cyclic nucleotide-binding domain-containing protein [Bacteroidota bacterium]